MEEIKSTDIRKNGYLCSFAWEDENNGSVEIVQPNGTSLAISFYGKKGNEKISIVGSKKEIVLDESCPFYSALVKEIAPKVPGKKYRTVQEAARGSPFSKENEQNPVEPNLVIASPEEQRRCVITRKNEEKHDRPDEVRFEFDLNSKRDFTVETECSSNEQLMGFKESMFEGSKKIATYVQAQENTKPAKTAKAAAHVA